MSMNELLAVVNSDPTVPINELITSILQSGSQEFTSSGTFTVPYGITEVYVTALGAGGGGGYALPRSSSPYQGGGGGGAGNYVKKQKISVTPGEVISVTVGVGGAGGTGYSSSSDGQAGGNTTFGSYLTVTGGGAGNYQGTGGSSNYTGGTGTTTTSRAGGNGGASKFGTGGTGATNSSNANATTPALGAGGGGGYGYSDSASTHPHRNGGVGGNGYCIVEYGNGLKYTTQCVKSIQRGVLTTTSAGEKSVTISPVTISKSIAFGQGTDTSYNGTTSAKCYFPYVDFVNNSTLSIGGGGVYTKVIWQVIEFY